MNERRRTGNAFKPSECENYHTSHELGANHRLDHVQRIMGREITGETVMKTENQKRNQRKSSGYNTIQQRGDDAVVREDVRISNGQCRKRRDECPEGIKNRDPRRYRPTRGRQSRTQHWMFACY